MTDERIYYPVGYQEIMAQFPRLLYTHDRLREQDIDASAAILPEHLRPEGMPEGTSTIMGLPIIWGDRLALVVDA